MSKITTKGSGKMENIMGKAYPTGKMGSIIKEPIETESRMGWGNSNF
jgi:hypothetical protein